MEILLGFLLGMCAGVSVAILIQLIMYEYEN